MLLHRPWLKYTSPLLSPRILHIDAYVRGDASTAYLDIHATLGGTVAKARDVYDVTSFTPSWVTLGAMPDGVHAMTWTARDAGVPWRAVHAYVRHTAETLHPRGLGTFPWLATSLLCHYVARPDIDPFLGRRRTLLQNANTKYGRPRAHVE
jgi:hypothetical protein